MIERVVAAGIVDLTGQRGGLDRLGRAVRDAAASAGTTAFPGLPTAAAGEAQDGASGGAAVELATAGVARRTAGKAEIITRLRSAAHAITGAGARIPVEARAAAAGAVTAAELTRLFAAAALNHAVAERVGDEAAIGVQRFTSGRAIGVRAVAVTAVTEKQAATRASAVAGGGGAVAVTAQGAGAVVAVFVDHFRAARATGSEGKCAEYDEDERAKPGSHAMGPHAERGRSGACRALSRWSTILR